MPLPEAPRKRGTILDASAYGKKTADVSTKPATKTATIKTAAKTKTAATEVKETTRPENHSQKSCQTKQNRQENRRSNDCRHA